MANCRECNEPVKEGETCACNPELCHFCCGCDNGCSCGCKEKE